MNRRLMRNEILSRVQDQNMSIIIDYSGNGSGNALGNFLTRAGYEKDRSGNYELVRDVGNGNAANFANGSLFLNRRSFPFLRIEQGESL